MRSEPGPPAGALGTGPPVVGRAAGSNRPAGRSSLCARCQAPAGSAAAGTGEPVGPEAGRPGLAGFGKREAAGAVELELAGPGADRRVPAGPLAGAAREPAEAFQRSGARRPAGPDSPFGTGRATEAMSRPGAGPRARAAEPAAVPVPCSALNIGWQQHPSRSLLSQQPGQLKSYLSETPCSQPPIRISSLYGVPGTPSSRSA